jgi:hypothetical protein
MTVEIDAEEALYLLSLLVPCPLRTRILDSLRDYERGHPPEAVPNPLGSLDWEIFKE